MRNTKILLFGIIFPLLLLSTACDEYDDSEEIAICGNFFEYSNFIRYGTSFGHCLGYCNKTWDVYSHGIDLTIASWHDDEFPTQYCSLPVESEDCMKIREELDLEKIKALPATIGCPDCADGGAEWIEVDIDGEVKRVTFEYNADIPELQEILKLLRAVRNEYNECAS